MTGRTLLVVPMTGVATLASGPGRATHGGDAPEDAAPGEGPAVPHVRLVDPFTDPGEVDEGVVAELRGFFADVVPFPVRITGLAPLPGGAACLTLDPAAPFRNLAHGVHRLFPEVPRARAALDLVPHLVVPLDEGTSVAHLRSRVGSRLPLATLAAEAALWAWSDDGVRTLARFPFGTSAA